MDDGLTCTEITKAGHPLPCSSGTFNSRLWVLHAASVHYPALRKICYSAYMVRKCHDTVSKINCTLSTFDYKVLCDLMHIKGMKSDWRKFKQRRKL